MRALGPDLSHEETQNLRDLYAEEVRHTDAQVGELLAYLAKLGLEDETVVVITSDHGEEIFERGYLGHAHSLHEELVRVPLLVRAPGAAPRVVPEPVSLVALTPTLLDLLGVDRSERTFQADSLAPSLVQDAHEPEPFIFFEVDYLPDKRVERTARKRGVIRGSSKLVVDRDTGDVTLYDLATDPGEHENLAAARPETVAELRLVLEAHDRSNASARARNADPEATGATLSPEDRARLEELGYLEPAP